MARLAIYPRLSPRPKLIVCMHIDRIMQCGRGFQRSTTTTTTLDRRVSFDSSTRCTSGLPVSRWFCCAEDRIAASVSTLIYLHVFLYRQSRTENILSYHIPSINRSTEIQLVSQTALVYTLLFSANIWKKTAQFRDLLATTVRVKNVCPPAMAGRRQFR